MDEKQYDVGAVGERDVVTAFRAIGMRALPAHSAEGVARAVHTLVKEGIPVIFITENAARIAPETLQKYQSDPNVALIPIPGSRGTDGFGMQRVKANGEKAIGADILFNNEQ